MVIKVQKILKKKELRKQKQEKEPKVSRIHNRYHFIIPIHHGETSKMTGSNEPAGKKSRQFTFPNSSNPRMNLKDSCLQNHGDD